jgi:hypothetical protein
MKTNEEILTERVELFDQQIGPRVGDYIRLKSGKLTRITSSGMSTGGEDGGSYYLNELGNFSYSGGLHNINISKHDLVDTGETIDGPIWFFNNGIMRPRNKAEFNIQCRIYELRQLYNETTI